MKSLTAHITEQEKGDIVSAVKKAESMTSGEIVPMIVSASSPYVAAGFLSSLTLAICASSVATVLLAQWNACILHLPHFLLYPADGRLTGFFLFLALFFPAFLIASFLVREMPALKKFFLPRDEMTEQVAETAYTAFHRHGLSRTRDHNGILIFVSLFERQVRIIADRAIDERIGSDTWQEIADTLARGIRGGALAGSVRSAVERCGEELAKHFPSRPDDTNELEDLIVEK